MPISLSFPLILIVCSIEIDERYNNKTTKKKKKVRHVRFFPFFFLYDFFVVPCSKALSDSLTFAIKKKNHSRFTAGLAYQKEKENDST